MVVLSAELGPELSTASTPSTGALPTTKRALAACGLRAALGFTFAALAYVGNRRFANSDYNAEPDHTKWNTCAGYTKNEFVGVALVTFGFPLAWLCLSSAAVSAARLRPQIAVPVLLGLLACSVAAFVEATKDAEDLLKCGVVFCYKLSDKELAKKSKPPYTIVLGGALMFGAGALGLLQLGLAVAALRRLTKSSRKTEAEEGLLGSGPPRALLHSGGDDEAPAAAPRGVARKAAAPSKMAAVAWTVALLAVLAGLLLLTALLPNSWDAFSPSAVASYQKMNRGDRPTPWSQEEPEGPDDRGAWFRTTFRELVPGKLVLKLYPDVAMYYAFLAFLAVAACAARVFPSVGRVLARRVAIPGPWRVVLPGGSADPETKRRPPPYVLYEVGGGTASLGALVLVAAFAALLFCYSRYVYVDHLYQNNAKASTGGGWLDTKGGAWERAARGTGQLANLGLALLLLPIARHSVLTDAFGIAWEQALWAHILLGYFVLACFIVHAGCWFKVYAMLDIFPDDVLEVPMYYPTNGQPKSAGRCADNWTVPLAVVTTIAALVLMGGLAHYEVRRRRFEVFYYAHHCFLAIYATALWHAASCWYLVLGGLAHWAADRLLRLKEAGRAWTVACCEARADGVVHLELAPADGGRVFAYAPGQYAFLCLPDISHLESHPFTLSAAPSDAAARNRLAFDIKAMPPHPGLGKNAASTFTQGLRRLAEARSSDPATIRVAVEGPCGAAFDASRHDAVLLVAGGIGVTVAAKKWSDGPRPGPRRGRENGGRTNAIPGRGPRKRWSDNPRPGPRRDREHVVGRTPPPATASPRKHGRTNAAPGRGVAGKMRSDERRPRRPCHAIFRELYAEARARQDAALVDGSAAAAATTTTLVWVARDRNVLDLFGPTLREAAADDLGGRFRLSLYVDAERGAEAWGTNDAFRGIPFVHGRPDVSRAIADLKAAGAAAPHCFVCGPPGLAAACSAAALARGVDFHSEVFAF